MHLINSGPYINVTFLIIEDADKVVEIIKDHYLTSHSMPHSIEKTKEHYTTAKIHSIYLYPIKSCAPMKVSRWPLDSSSLLYDRSFVIMQGRKPLTQKMLPMLCMIRPIIDLESGLMTISCPGEKNHVLNLYECDSKNIERTCSGISNFFSVVVGLTENPSVLFKNPLQKIAKHVFGNLKILSG